MASVVVDGLAIPISVGGHPALDFCNTRAGWGSPAPKEYLASHAHLCVWARENGLITPSAVRRLRGLVATAPHEAEAVVTRAVRLREALYAVLLRQARPRDWSAVNVEVRRAAAASALTPGAFGATWRLSSGTGMELPLLAVAWAAAEFLTTSTASTAGVSACPGTGCGWLFSDPRGRRRWCSMAMCGNRAKVRRHAQRLRGPTSNRAGDQVSGNGGLGTGAECPT